MRMMMAERKTPNPKKTISKPTRRKKFVLAVLLSVVSLGILGEEASEWIGSYSSDDLEDSKPQEIKDSKVYYYWQLESLKRSVQPRYIRMMDIESYSSTGSLITKGILFTYNGLNVSEVNICGNHSAWKCMPMRKNKFGIFYFIVPTEFRKKNLEDNPIYKYKFQVDGLFEFDPENPRKREDGEGSFYSEFLLTSKDVNKQAYSMVIDNVKGEEEDFRTIEFKIYSPDAENVSLVGDFNDWNPENDYLIKNRDGLYSMRKKLRPGNYLYHFIIDGKNTLDTYNPETRLRTDTNEISSLLIVSERNQPIEKL